jgi:hypothetical protein
MIGTRWKIAGLALAATFACETATAQDDADFCRNGLFGEEAEDVGVAEVLGTERLYFLEDMNGCPNATAACRQQSYVIPGDRLITARTKGEYVCAYYPNAGGGSAGWVPRNRLRQEAVDREPGLYEWAGEWADGDSTVDFSASSNALWVEGYAFWPSASPDPKLRPGGPNIGEVVGLVQVDGNRAFEPECEIRFTLLGDYLVVSDPTRHCDGMNVTFSGVYTRPRR